VCIESDDSLSPIELDHHEAIKVSIVLSTREVVVGFDEGISHGLSPGEEVMHFSSGIVLNVAEGFDVGQPLDIPAVIFEPDGSVESHFVVLHEGEVTISSMDLESLEKISLNTLSRSYSLEARSS
jgi:hypothetical protein